MTDPPARPPAGLDVAIGPVAGGGRRRRSGARAASVVGGALALVVAAAVLGGTSGERDGPLRTAAASPRGAVAEDPTSAPSSRPRPADRLPALRNEPLPGAPTVVFYRRSGDDLEQLEWSPGGPSAIERNRLVRGALGGIGPIEPYAAIPSPDGSRIAVRGLAGFGSSTTDVVRIVGPDGRFEWTGAGAGLPIAPLWSPDGRRVLLPGSAASWRILTLADTGPVETTLDPAAVEVGPREIAQPLAFSRDSQWLYVAVTDPRRSRYHPVARYAADTGEATPLAAFPVDGPAAPAPEGRLGYTLDPRSGRLAVGPTADLAVGPTDIRVFEADGSAAFTVRLDTVAGLTWAGDGRLLVLETDVLPGPSRIRLLPIDSTGRVGDALLQGGRLTWASLAGARDGYALLALAAGRSPAGVVVVVLRLSDGATATLPITPGLATELHFADWRS